MKILMTGFVPFPGVEINPSELLVRYYQDGAVPVPEGVQIVAEVLPTAFEDAGYRIREIIQEEQPDVVLGLGVAQKRDKINIERVAHNWDEAKIPDNDGVLRSGQKIVPDGKETYFSTLPVEKMLAALTEANIPAVLSDDAGRYVCNHVFYSAHRQLEELGRDIPCGFIHIPGLAGVGDFPGWEMERLLDAVKRCVEVVAQLA